ncbi:MAG: short-chain dehydrogenase [Chloroflexi bacterium]|nr:MAG: short-chain dehydrogenase [Chloroflexota bacterium]
MTGKICLVTGATNGIGKATAQALAQMGATVVIVGRNPAKCAAVVSEIKQISGNDAVAALVADLSIMAEVRRVADQFKAKYPQLHVLVNNAGAAFGKRQVTAEGFERTFALNHLSPFLLTTLLLDTLKASAPARIVNVSSDSHKGAHLDFDDLQSEKGNFVFNAYGRSKLAVILFSYELARRLSGTAVTANVLHPGLVRTGFASNLGAAPSAVIGFFMRFAGVTPAQGAQTSLYLATSPAVANVTGKYWEKSKAAPSGRATYDEATWTRLWEASDKMVEARATAG